MVFNNAICVFVYSTRYSTNELEGFVKKSFLERYYEHNMVIFRLIFLKLNSIFINNCRFLIKQSSVVVLDSSPGRAKMYTCYKIIR